MYRKKHNIYIYIQFYPPWVLECTLHGEGGLPCLNCLIVPENNWASCKCLYACLKYTVIASDVLQKLNSDFPSSLITISFLEYYGQFSLWKSLWTALWTFPQHNSRDLYRVTKPKWPSLAKWARVLLSRCHRPTGHGRSLSWGCKFLTISEFLDKQLCRFLFIAFLLFP